MHHGDRLNQIRGLEDAPAVKLEALIHFLCLLSQRHPRQTQPLLRCWSPEEFVPGIPTCLTLVLLLSPLAATQHLVRSSPAGICPQHPQSRGSPGRGEIQALLGGGELPVPDGRAP